MRFTWTTPWDVTAALTWRYFGKVDVDTTSDNSLLKGSAPEIVRTFGARNYLDVSASYALSKNVTLRGGINNLLDKDPPIAATGAPYGNGNTYPVVYDALGRRISLNVAVTF